MSIDPDDWRPGLTMEALRARADLLRITREFFAARDVLEVETPALAEYGATDPHIAGLTTRLSARPDKRQFLQTSPEYAMKRLLAAGCPDIYQVCRVFRDGELGRRHRPEFTMIEWYRRDLTLDAMIDETCLLVSTLIGAADGAFPTATVARYRYAALFLQTTGCDPLSADTRALRDRALELVPGPGDDVARQLGDRRDGWLDLLMSHVVIPSLPAAGLSVIHHYPAEQGALARLDPEDRRWAERFEVFGGGIELANGYRELTDAREQRMRFSADRACRAASGLPDVRADRRLLAALEHGLPDCCGVAVGFDRVLMLAVGAESIDEVVGFPL